MARLLKRFTSLELRARRQAKRAHNRKHMAKLAAISTDRHAAQIVHQRFPVTRKTNKRGAGIEYPEYTQVHHVGVNAAGHHISFTVSKAQWLQQR